MVRPFLYQRSIKARLHIPIYDASDGRGVVDVHDDPHGDAGSYTLSVPNGSERRFGNDFESGRRRRRYESFMNLVTFLQRDLLDELFTEFMTLYENEYDIALSVVDELNYITDKLSRWAFHIFFANPE
jgi:hypothetical protein